MDTKPRLKQHSSETLKNSRKDPILPKFTIYKPSFDILNTNPKPKTIRSVHIWVCTKSQAHDTIWAIWPWLIRNKFSTLTPWCKCVLDLDPTKQGHYWPWVPLIEIVLCISFIWNTLKLATLINPSQQGVKLLAFNFVSGCLRVIVKINILICIYYQIQNSQ